MSITEKLEIQGKAASCQEAAFFCKKISDRKIRILRIDFKDIPWQYAANDCSQEVV